MARKPDIQYIQFYTDGSAARQVAPKLPKRKKPAAQPQPRPQSRKRVTIQLDPVAVCGILVAAVMLVLMVVGLVRLEAAEQQMVALERYISALEEENAQLQMDYSAGYDLAEVESAALALGMVPVEDIEQIPIQVTVPEVVEEPTFWERVSNFFTDLFA